MKGFRTVIKGGFAKQGLASDYTTARNTGLFVDCKNVRMQPTGLEGYNPEIADLLSGEYPLYDYVTHNPVTITRRWPFPQLFMTDMGLWIGALEGLYLVFSTTPPIYVVSLGTGATVWPWCCIPIPNKPAFCSGNKFVYYDPNAAAYTVVT